MKKNITIWIVIGVVVGVAIIFLAVKGNILPRAGLPKGEKVQTPVGEAVQTAPGTSLITEKGQVVNQEGKAVKNDVLPGSPEAPQQSNPVSEESLPPESVKLEMMSGGITPNTFTVKSGQAITLAATAKDSMTHVFKFRDPSLEAVALGLAPGETRAISFNAPKTKGEYEFYCDVPGHAGRGETGKMIVK